MAKLKIAEDWPVRDASPCPRCGPWCRHARTRPTAAIDLPDQPTRGHLFTGVVADVGRRGGRRGGRGGLSMPPPRVDRGAGMLRATPSTIKTPPRTAEPHGGPRAPRDLFQIALVLLLCPISAPRTLSGWRAPGGDPAAPLRAWRRHVSDLIVIRCAAAVR